MSKPKPQKPKAPPPSMRDLVINEIATAGGFWLRGNVYLRGINVDDQEAVRRCLNTMDDSTILHVYRDLIRVETEYNDAE